MKSTKTITIEDLKNAIRYCEYVSNSFAIDDIWYALKNPKAEISKELNDSSDEFINLKDYRITKFPRIGFMKHITIRRKDKKPIHSWKDIQEIKNKVCGQNVEACELYPSENRLVDTDNIYHLWVLPKGTSFPFGFNERNVK
jgi:hypothetical protein